MVIVDPPHIRAAGSIDADMDLAALGSFRSYLGSGVWYEREAEKVVRRATRYWTEGELGERDRLFLIEREDQLLAVAVFEAESDLTAHLGFVGLSRDVHGARIDSPIFGQSLCSRVRAMIAGAIGAHSASRISCRSGPAVSDVPRHNDGARGTRTPDLLGAI
jgi:hypothetical protein